MYEHVNPSGVFCSVCWNDFASDHSESPFYSTALDDTELVQFCHENKHILCAFCAVDMILRPLTKTVEGYTLFKLPTCPTCRSDIHTLNIFFHLCARVEHHGRRVHTAVDETNFFNAQDMQNFLTKLQYNRHHLLYTLVATDAHKFVDKSALQTFAKKQYSDDYFLQDVENGEIVLCPFYTSGDDSEFLYCDDWEQAADTASAAMMLAFRQENPQAMKTLKLEYGATTNVAIDGDGLGLADVFEMFCDKTEDDELYIMRMLINDFGFDVENDRTENETRILHSASTRGFWRVVSELLEDFEANLDAEDKTGFKAVHYATKFGHTQTVHVLLNAYPEQMYQGPLGFSCVQIAAQNGHTELLRTFVKNYDIDLLDDVNESTQALRAAVEGGHLDTVSMLIKEAGADATVVTKDGCTLVLTAAKQGHIAMIRLLVSEGGVDVNIGTRNGWTPVHAAAENGHASTVRVLVCEYHADCMTSTMEQIGDNGKGWTPLHVATRRQNTETVQTLLKECKANPMIADYQGHMPVHFAAENNVDILRELVRFKADVNVHNKFFETPIYLAAKAGNTDSVLALVKEFGVDANVKLFKYDFDMYTRDRKEISFTEYISLQDDNTPLLVAIRNNDMHMVRLLVETCDVRLNLEDQIAAACRATINPDMLVYLIKTFKIDLNQRYHFTGFDGQTPLFFKLIYGDARIPWALVNACDVDVNVRDRYGETALFHAARSDHNVVRALLEQCHADPHVVNSKGHQAVHAAAIAGMQESIQVILAKSDVQVIASTLQGDSIPHLLARYHHFEELEWFLVEYDMDANWRNEGGDTFLHHIVRSSKPGCNPNTIIHHIRNLVEQYDANIHWRNFDHDTILHSAVVGGCCEIVDFLLKTYKFALESKNARGATPLFLAAQFGHTDLVQSLYRGWLARPDARDKTGRTPLMIASFHGYEKVIEVLIRKCFVSVHDTDQKGWTALFYASSKNKVSTVIKLLDEYGANDPSEPGLNHRSTSGETAIFVAAASGHKDVVMVLLRHEANPRIIAKCDEEKSTELRLREPITPKPARLRANAATPDYRGCTPVWIAASQGHTHTVRILVQLFKVDPNIANNNGDNALHAAVENGMFKMARVLLQEFGMDIEAKNNVGKTPLHLAAIKQNYDILNYLLSVHGANVNITDGLGETVFFYDLDPNFMVELVESYGVNRYAQNKDRYTALEKAIVVKAKISLVDTLVHRCGMDVNVHESGQYSPLCLAVLENNLQMVHYLLDKCNANIHLPCTEDLVQAVHVGAQYGTEEMVKLLINAGANAQALDLYGNTPIFKAVLNTTNDALNVQQYLLGLHGINVNLRNAAGETPVLIAVQEGTVDSVSILFDKGADVMLTYENGLTLLDHANRRGADYAVIVERAYEIRRLLSRHRLSDGHKILLGHLHG